MLLHISRALASSLLFNLKLCTLFLQVSILIPECASLPASIGGVINRFNSYYRVRDLPLYKLLEKDFLERVVKNGRVTCLASICNKQVTDARRYNEIVHKKTVLILFFFFCLITLGLLKASFNNELFDSTVDSSTTTIIVV